MWKTKKARNNYKKHPKSLLITGARYFVHQTREIAFSSPDWRVKTLDFSLINSRLRRALALLIGLLNADLWYRIWGYYTWRQETICRIAHKLGVPIVIHWIGTDVLYAANYFDKNQRSLKVAQRFIHWAKAPWLVDELRELGIEASFVPSTGKRRRMFLSQDPPKLPSRFTILTYIPDNRPKFYGWDKILQLAKDFPEIDILVVKGEGEFATSPPPNIRFLGWVDNMYDIYKNCTVVVRMTEHDGYSGSVQESLILGRHVIWTYPFPGVLQAQDYLSLRSHIEGLLDLHFRGLLKINKKGREFIQQNLNPEVLSAQMQERIREYIRQER